MKRIALLVALVVAIAAPALVAQNQAARPVPNSPGVQVEQAPAVIPAPGPGQQPEAAAPPPLTPQEQQRWADVVRQYGQAQWLMSLAQREMDAATGELQRAVQALSRPGFPFHPGAGQRVPEQPAAAPPAKKDGEK